MNSMLLRLAVTLLVAVPAMAATAPSCCHPPMAASAPLPAASLYQTEVDFTTDADAPFRLAELRGQPVALVMFFASCGHACPATVVDLVRIREKIPADVRANVRIVMVTFDVERDTPAALRVFRENRGIPSDWVLLHGSNDAVRELAALLGVKYKREADGMFAHSNLITILSRDGEITHQRAGLTGGLDEAAAALGAAARAVDTQS
ncbi:MAG: SCO family protein [Opitutaceae bacterium]|nr:SCO family protein [Opitutaceae bacterium]